MISSERASQDEQNGANFSFVAPSNEELWMRKEIQSKPCFSAKNCLWPFNDIIGKGISRDFGQKLNIFDLSKNMQKHSSRGA